MQELLKRSPGIIIVACVWSNYATNSFMPASATARPLAALSLANFASPLKDAVLALSRAGHHVVIVGQVPLPVGDSIDCIQRLQMTGRDASECAATTASRAEVDSKVKPLLQEAAGSIPSVGIVYPFERYCNAQDCPIFTADGRFIYMDASHLSPAGASLLSADMGMQIASLLRQKQAAIP
jgi:SGNH domain (fused to AT3 domains)